MSILEETKKIFESMTSYATPNKREIGVLIQLRKPNLFYFKDDGQTPNNQKNPLIYYRTPVRLDPQFDPATIFETLFLANGWQNSWRNSIYSFLHFHTNRHEVLGIARGHARVQLGGKKGHILQVKAGDVIIIPAGMGHSSLSKSKDLLVVGAYPSNSGEYDEPKPHDIDHTVAVKNISQVKKPLKDPVYGKKGPLVQFWN